MAAASPILSLIAAALALVGLIGAYLGLLAPMAGFMTFVSGALFGGLFATVLALIGLFLSRGDRDPQGKRKALVGLAIALGLLIVVLGAASTGGDAPPINDITTDLENPPAFADPAGIPEYAGRNMQYPEEFVPIVAEHYPDLASIRIDADVDRVYARALETARSLGWEIVGENQSDGLIFAKEETSLFRFVDDVIVRVMPSGMGSRVDVRSKSRDGRGDLGANAARIRRFLEALPRS